MQGTWKISLSGIYMRNLMDVRGEVIGFNTDHTRRTSRMSDWM
jgi:hypothetical protein